MNRREARRLAIVERQTLLARIERRNALAGLSSAIAEESTSEALAARSRKMAGEYSRRIDAREAGKLADRARFIAALSGLASEAERARADAKRQAEWRAQAFAASEQRMKRLEERGLEMRRAIMDAREARDNTEVAVLAHNLQKKRRGASLRRQSSGGDHVPGREGNQA